MPDADLARRWIKLAVKNPAEAVDRALIKAQGFRPSPSGSGEQAPATANGVVESLGHKGWEEALHHRLGWPWPCTRGGQFAPLWQAIQASLSPIDTARDCHDADPAFARCLWCMISHQGPRSVVETGVARGITSRVVLESLRSNGRGRLYSIDLPPLSEPWYSESGSAVPDELLPGWTYLRGSSQRLLPKTLRRLGSIDVFIHDSLHTYNHMMFELGLASCHLSDNGVMVADDIDHNTAFFDFVNHQPLMNGAIVPHETKSGAIGIAWLKRD